MTAVQRVLPGSFRNESRRRNSFRAERPAKLYLIRHGHTEANEPGMHTRMSGWSDVPLSETGSRETEALYARLRREAPFDALYSSSLARARQTAERFHSLSGTPLVELDELREIGCGELDGAVLGEIKRDYPELWERNLAQEEDDLRWPGGESYREFRERSTRGIDRIAADHAGQRVLIVTHCGVINQLLGVVHKFAPACWEKFRPRNASVSTLLWSYGWGKLLLFDDAAHLKHLHREHSLESTGRSGR